MPEKKGRRKNAAPLFRDQPATLYDQDADPVVPSRKTRRRSSGTRLYTLAMVFCALVFLASAGILAKRFLDDRRTENEFQNLASLIDTTAAQPSETGETTEDNGRKFAALQARNPDFFGWISIEGTNLNFPVMYAPDNKDFYLRHDFDGQYSNYGVPYLDEKCVVTGEDASNNLVVYGHNMKTGTIFGCLTGYKEADYYTQHPRIQFDTVYGDGVYEVFAAFAIDVVQDTSFAYNTYLNLDENEFQAFVSQVKSRSDVDSGITPVYGDQLLTLSTCEYSTANGRYVVCARRLEGENKQ